MKIDWYKKEGGLNEIYQQVGMSFAFASAPKNGNKQCHQFFKCRDFLHDAIRAHLIKSEVSIYGFSHRYGRNPDIDMNRTRLLVTDKKKNSKGKARWKEHMKRALELVNCYEELAGVSKSKLYFVGDNEGYSNTWLFVGPSMWMKSPYLISMYSFLIRLGVKNINTKNVDSIENSFKEIIANEGDVGDNDTKYLKSTALKMRAIAGNWRELFVPNKEKYDSVYTDLENVTASNFHDYCGIFSLCSGYVNSKASLADKFKKIMENDKDQ